MQLGLTLLKWKGFLCFLLTVYSTVFLQAWLLNSKSCKFNED
jgi:hypothetical protein